MRLANHPRGSRKNSHKNSFIGARNVCTFMSRDIKGGPHRRTTFVSKELARYKPNSEQVGLSKGHHHHHHHHYHHLSLNCEGRWGTTDDFTTSFLHFSLFSKTKSLFCYFLINQQLLTLLTVKFFCHVLIHFFVSAAQPYLGSVLTL